MAGTRPVIMNAGASPVGQAFAIRNCDAFFLQASRTSLDETAQRVADRQEPGTASRAGSSASIPSASSPAGRPGRRPRTIITIPSWSTPTGRRSTASSRSRTSRRRTRRRRSFIRCAPDMRRAWAACRSSAIPTTWPSQLIDLSKAGLTGIAVSLVNYVDELPFFCDEVLPRLRARGSARDASIMTARVGLIIPSSNRMVEQEMVPAFPAGVAGPCHAPAHDRHQSRCASISCLPRIEEAARALTDARCDVVAFHCTANSMEGRQDRRGANSRDALSQAGAPRATTTITAIQRAFRCAGARAGSC